MRVLDDLRYTKDHEWVRRAGEEFVAGITDYAQQQLSDIVYVELPAVGMRLTQAEPFGSVEAVKAVADLFAPASGEVVAVNESLMNDPAAVNRSPYEEGWMIRVKASDPKQFDGLLTAEKYRALLAELGGASA
ncbi:MAG: glycine cleavage system protein GcvH [Candidatus Eisenbacteria bacterium]